MVCVPGWMPGTSPDMVTVVLAATQFWGLTGTEDTAIEVASMEVRASIGIGVSERERRRSSVQPSREGRPPRRRAPDLGITWCSNNNHGTNLC